MKKLKIYKESGEFVIERVNEFDHATKRFFITKEGLLEGLQAYESVLADYDLVVDTDLFATVINFLNSGMVSGAVKDKLEQKYIERHVGLTLSHAEELLYKMDKALDRLEGKGAYIAFVELQDLLLEWNLLGHNFAYSGLQDWIESDD